MALIKCPDCKNDVSTSASACPKCGAPVSTQQIDTPVTTIEQTSKKLKKHIIFSVIAFIVGMVMVFNAIDDKSSSNKVIMAIGAILSSIGAWWFIITKIRIWWHHK